MRHVHNINKESADAIVGKTFLTMLILHLNLIMELQSYWLVENSLLIKEKPDCFVPFYRCRHQRRSHEAALTV